MKPLFDRKFVYPSDREGGPYVEFEGPVVDVTSAHDAWRMVVRVLIRLIPKGSQC
jgi:hypothetical protein